MYLCCMKALKIAITGVESTGKSTLTVLLATHFQSLHLTEFARLYLPKLQRPYGRMDVLRIGQQQIMRQETMDALIAGMVTRHEAAKVCKPFFFDTELTVIKIWYETKYQKALPEYLERAYQLQDFDLYILPYPDLEWETDNLREHQSLETRLQLFAQYEAELQRLERPYCIIRGTGEARNEQAIEIIRELCL